MSESDYARRTRARTAINRLGGHADVAAVSFVPAAEGPTGRPVVELAIRGDAVPPAVLRELGRAELSIFHTHRSSGVLRVVAVAE